VSGISQTFRNRLGSALHHDGRSMREISRTSGYSATYIKRLIDGMRSNPTLAFVEVISTTLNCDPAWMLGFKEEA